MMSPHLLRRSSNRITSYNVCYTKLLRLGAIDTFFDYYRNGDIEGKLRQSSLFLNDNGGGGMIGEVDIVITSYSIHYTKLYDAAAVRAVSV